MTTDLGRVPSEAGSSPTDQAPTGLAASRVDPSRWPAIEWDDDGYPVGEDTGFFDYAFEPLNFACAARFLLDELPRAAQHRCCSCEVEDTTDDLSGRTQIKRITFSTGGWSGAESLMGFVEGRFDAKHFMVSWRRGGHYVFEIPKRLFPSDSDGNPKGGDGTAPSQSDDSAGLQGIAKDMSHD